MQKEGRKMTFKDLKIINPIQDTLRLIGYEKPTPIQEDSIPILLDKQDLLGSAQTGTGKTAAFAIPILQHIYKDKSEGNIRGIKALILTPTRELAIQVEKDFRTYSKNLKIRNTTVYGGVPQKSQASAIRRGVDVLIATPGRLLDLMNQGIINLNKVKYLVLDEADLMLDMGFINDVLKIVNETSKDRLTMLFSATMPKEIEELAKEILTNPIRVAITPVTQTIDAITQTLYHVKRSNKTTLLKELIEEDLSKSWLVFSRTKHNANRLAESLIESGIKADSIHGDKSQKAREKALNGFKEGKINVLVATDIASRGIDIEKLDYVVNYDLPEMAETYIHRIGRTGRAGLKGSAITFCDPSERKLLAKIESHTKVKIIVINNELTEKDIFKNTKKGTKNKKPNFNQSNRKRRNRRNSSKYNK